MWDLGTGIKRRAPELLELGGVGLVAGGLWSLVGAGAAILWLGVACFGASYVVEMRRTREREDGRR